MSYRKIDKQTGDELMEMLRWFRTLPGGGRPSSFPHEPQNPDGFWARITDSSGDKYSFEALHGSSLEGDHSKEKGYAREIFGSENVLHDAVVYLRPKPKSNYYIFEYHASLTAEASEDVTATGAFSLEVGEQEIDCFNPYPVDAENPIEEGHILTLVFRPGYGDFLLVGAQCSEEEDE